MPKKSKIIEFPHLRALLEQDDANRAENAAGKQASDSAPEPEGEKKSIWQELRDIELPTALQSKEVMLCTVAVLMTLTVIVLSITLLSVRLLMFLLFPVYLLYCAVSLRLDFKDGTIRELPMICYSVQTNAISNGLKGSTKVCFRTDDDVPSYFTFTLPRKVTFYPNCPYLVYINEKNTASVICLFADVSTSSSGIYPYRMGAAVFLPKHSGTSELRNLYSCLSQFCKWQKGRYAVTIQKKYRKHKESSVSILYGYWLFIYPKSHKTKRRNEKMFTNDYFTKAMGYVIDGESRGSKESAMKYLTGSGFMERQEAESYLAHLFRVWRNLSAANAR